MTPIQPNDARVKDLVAKFIEISIAQHRAVYVLDSAKYNRLYKTMERVKAELKAMPGDQRRTLLPLLLHPNVQVRLSAAHAVLALYPALARKTLEDIRDSGIEPQNTDAAMSISNLDEGVYIPK